MSELSFDSLGFAERTVPDPVKRKGKSSCWVCTEMLGFKRIRMRFHTTVGRDPLNVAAKRMHDELLIQREERISVGNAILLGTRLKDTQSIHQWSNPEAVVQKGDRWVLERPRK